MVSRPSAPVPASSIAALAPLDALRGVVLRRCGVFLHARQTVEDRDSLETVVSRLGVRERSSDEARAVAEKAFRDRRIPKGVGQAGDE